MSSQQISQATIANEHLIYPRYMDPFHLPLVTSTLSIVIFSIMLIFTPHIVLKDYSGDIARCIFVANGCNIFGSLIIFFARCGQYPKFSWKYSHFSPYNHFIPSHQLSGVAVFSYPVVSFLINFVFFMYTIWYLIRSGPDSWLDPDYEWWNGRVMALGVLFSMIAWFFSLLGIVYTLHRSCTLHKYAKFNDNAIEIQVGVVAGSPSSQQFHGGYSSFQNSSQPQTYAQTTYTHGPNNINNPY